MRGAATGALTLDRAMQEAMRLHRSGELARSARLYDAVLAASPQHFDALHLLGLVRWQQKREREAFRRMRSALVIAPADSGAHGNLGSMLKDLGRNEAALRHYRKATAVRPDQVEIHSNLAITLKALGRHEEAMARCRTALVLNPAYADPHSNLGDLLCEMSEATAAVRTTRRALALDPGLDRARRNLLSICLNDPSLSPAERFGLHRRHGARPGPAPRAVRLRVAADPTRIIRVGYLSSDFRWHPVGRNMLPIVRAHDRRRVAVHLYSTAAGEDDFGKRFRAAADRFHSLAGRTEDAIAETVAEDRIDILVILAAHFDESPIQVACHRPAPVIVSFHDAATSGLAEVDYLMADSTMVPGRTEELFSERVVRLPGMYVYEPDDAAPPAGPRDAGTPLTFASLNNPTKLNERTLSLWAEILGRTPGSELLFQYKDRYRSRRLTDSMRAVFARHGIRPERLVFLGPIDDRQAYPDLCGRIDVALDCFPFNGATTTFEALWMGVPVVSLAGDAMVGRTSMSFLRRVGLEDLVAATPADYVSIAVALAADETRRACLRERLRQRVARSPLCDGAKTARHLERAYRAMWRRWCRAAEGRATPGR